MQNEVSLSQNDEYPGYLSGRVLTKHTWGHSLILRTTKPNKKNEKHKKGSYII